MYFLKENILFLLLLIFCINITTFIVFGIDKYKAVKNKWRVPERTLIFLAVAGGTLGALFGMKMFHHKTNHAKFYLGIPIIFVLQMTLMFLFIWKFR